MSSVKSNIDQDQEQNSNKSQEKQKEVKHTKDDYTLLTVLGKGAYGKVMLVKSKIDKQVYAMKIIKKVNNNWQHQMERIQVERNILVKVRHPFVIKLHQSFQTDACLYFVMEYTPGGDLQNLLNKQKRFDENQTRFYMSQIVLGVEKLHDENIIHRDLKLDNILIDIDGYLRVADFGLSKDKQKAETMSGNIVGTPEYFAPELIINKKSEKSCDWWTLGCMMYEMITGYPPFRSHNIEELFSLILNFQILYPQTITDHCLDLMQQLLQKNPEHRLGTKNGAKEIMNHPWFKLINWDSLIEYEYMPPFYPQINKVDDVKYFNPNFTQGSLNSANSQSLINGKHYKDFSFVCTKIESQTSELDKVDENEDDDEYDNNNIQQQQQDQQQYKLQQNPYQQRVKEQDEEQYDSD